MICSTQLCASNMLHLFVLVLKLVPLRQTCVYCSMFACSQSKLISHRKLAFELQRESNYMKLCANRLYRIVHCLNSSPFLHTTFPVLPNCLTQPPFAPQLQVIYSLRLGQQYLSPFSLDGSERGREKEGVN